MAQTLSYVQSIFVIVPVFAPTVASVIMHATNWRFAVCFPAVVAFVLIAWIVRIPETLRPVLLFAHSCAFAVISVLSKNRTPFPAYCVGIAGLLAMQTLVIPNCNAAAMLPVGHFAGAASGVIGTVNTIGGATLGLIVTNLHTNGTNVLIIAQAVFAGCCLAVTILARKADTNESTS